MTPAPGPAPSRGGVLIPKRSIRATAVLTALYAPRPLWLPLLISLALGCAYAAWIVDPGVVSGHGPFWVFPEGTIGNGENDIAASLVAHLSVVQSPWTIPLLFVPTLNAPAGLDTFWLDPLPLLSLTGRGVAGLVGHPVNLLGPYILACFALNGLGMTALLAAAGQRSLLAAMAGSVIALSSPWHLFRWGHLTLMGQFLLLLALALYLASLRQPRRPAVTLGLALVSLVALLTNPYLFIMVGGIVGASLLQRALDGTIPVARMLLQGIVLAALLLGTMAVTGMLPHSAGQAGSPDYGDYALNLVSPFTPQMSGLVPSRGSFQLPQYEGFAYLGGGVLFLAIVGLPGLVAWLRTGLRRHAALAAVVTCLVLLAVSNRVVIDTVEIDFVIPWRLRLLLGTFRSGGRFVWVACDLVMAGAILLALRSRRRWVGAGVLLVACALQTVDTAPLRAAIRGTMGRAGPPGVDRTEAAQELAMARSLVVFPSFGCMDAEARALRLSRLQNHAQKRVAMEFQLLAARMNKPTNSFYSGRDIVDCAHEAASRQAPMLRGVLYVRPYAPPDPDPACKSRPHYVACFTRED